MTEPPAEILEPAEPAEPAAASAASAASGVERHKALAHPMRHRLLLALGHRPATVSQLAAGLDSHKGNIAHHLKVLRAAGLIRPAGTRQVRGGTEIYYERTGQPVSVPRDSYRSALPVTFAAVAEAIAGAAPDPFLVLRTMRLSAAQVAEITAILGRLAYDTVEAGADEPRYGLLLGLYQPGPEPPGREPPGPKAARPG